MRRGVGSVQRALSVRNILATIALLSTVSGTAFAAMYGTSSFKNSSIQGKDVKNGTLSAIKYSTAAKAWFKARDGAIGNTGVVGDVGDAGADANSTTSWAYNNTGLLRDWVDTARVVPSDPPNKDPRDWDSSSYGVEAFGAIKLQISTGGHQGIDMDGTDRLVVALSGMAISADDFPKQSAKTGGAITLPWKSNLSATATMSFLHRGNPNDGGAYGGRASGRLECTLQRANQANPSNFSQMGSEAYVSSNVTNEVVTLTLAANAKDVAAGTYNVAAYCVDADFNGTTQWTVVSGSMNALAAEQ